MIKDHRNCVGMPLVNRFNIGRTTICILYIFLFVNPELCTSKLLFQDKVIQRALRSAESSSFGNHSPKQLAESDTIDKRQILPGPYYAPGGPGCGPGGCSCCGCPSFSPSVACAPPVASLLPPPGMGPPLPPAPAGRLIPQALPGAPCEPGVECTGGSVCSMGICLCPPELVQEGTVCVSRTIYGVGPPPGPPLASGPLPLSGPPPSFAAPLRASMPLFPAYSPSIVPVLRPPVPVPVPVPAPIPFGGLCGPGCMPGGFCDNDFCRCSPGFGGCHQKRIPGTFSIDVPDSEEQA